MTEEKFRYIKFGEVDQLRECIEEAAKSSEVTSFAINAVGFGLYNPQHEEKRKNNDNK